MPLSTALTGKVIQEDATSWSMVFCFVCSTDARRESWVQKMGRGGTGAKNRRFANRQSWSPRAKEGKSVGLRGSISAEFTVIAQSRQQGKSPGTRMRRGSEGWASGKSGIWDRREFNAIPSHLGFAVHFPWAFCLSEFGSGCAQSYSFGGTWNTIKMKCQHQNSESSWWRQWLGSAWSMKQPLCKQSLSLSSGAKWTHAHHGRESPKQDKVSHSGPCFLVVLGT